MWRGRRQTVIPFLPFHRFFANLRHVFREVRNSSPFGNGEVTLPCLQRFEQRFLFAGHLTLEPWHLAVCLPEKKPRRFVRLAASGASTTPPSAGSPCSVLRISHTIGCRFHRDCRRHLFLCPFQAVRPGAGRPVHAPPKHDVLGRCHQLSARPRWLASTFLSPGARAGLRITLPPRQQLATLLEAEILLTHHLLFLVFGHEQSG